MVGIKVFWARVWLGRTGRGSGGSREGCDGEGKWRAASETPYWREEYLKNGLGPRHATRKWADLDRHNAVWDVATGMTRGW